MRIVIVVGVVVVGSVVLANLAFDFSFVHAMLDGIGVQGLFIGLATGGLVAALLTNEYWLTA
jgi:hypothetical protein